MSVAAKPSQNVAGAVGSPATRPALRLRATLALDFSYDPALCRTILSSSAQEPPLRVVRAFENPDSSALAHLHNVSGGLLGGDQLKLCVNVGPQASAQLTTTGATRIYRPRASALPATQANDIHVGSGALLEYVPDPIIPFAGARFAQRTTIRLEENAGLFWWEILAPGREARGELFEYERVEMRADIFSRGRLIFAENARLEPRSRDLSSLARLGPCRYWATFFICRAGLDSRAWLAEEAHLREAATALNRPGEVLWSISTLVADGLIIRGIALRGRDLATGLHHLWNASKLRLYGRDAIPPRKLP
jgi:urease accessory protein